MGYQNPSIADFKTTFYRDFPFGTDPNVAVLDQDITRAYQMVNIAINQALFAAQADYSIGYGLLAAHYLVTNLRASSQGMNGQYNFLQASKGVGQVSEGFSIPQRILDNPFWSMLTKTNYGAEFLMLVLPQMTGVMYGVYGGTRA